MVREVRGPSSAAGVRPAEPGYDEGMATLGVGEWTLEKLAERLRVSADVLLKANPQLSRPENLRPGVKINLAGLAKTLEQAPLEENPVGLESSDSGKLAE